MHQASWIHSPFALGTAFVYTRCGIRRIHLVAMTKVLPFQPASASAKYSPLPLSQPRTSHPRIFVPVVPIVVGCQVYNYHAMRDSMPQGMEVDVRSRPRLTFSQLHIADTTDTSKPYPMDNSSTKGITIEVKRVTGLPSVTGLKPDYYIILNVNGISKSTKKVGQKDRMVKWDQKLFFDTEITPSSEFSLKLRRTSRIIGKKDHDIDTVQNNMADLISGAKKKKGM
ncbi:hypothetical protein M422DRAFT_270520 [Sphaerobolus stellatus SS14]|uniref:C2 domain-containing protein n=1 Tax=Sphaerobolus stellatus (strain SS14) TaxID=990650 RepID=A0A0C9U255_SPHS4|nr:hypothetical protein M422DRAFT_270520 [Sphaerobolus stellatus SS14]